MPDTEKQITSSLRGGSDQKLTIWLFRQVTNTEYAPSVSSNLGFISIIHLTVLSVVIGTLLPS